MNLALLGLDDQRDHKSNSKLNQEEVNMKQALEANEAEHIDQQQRRAVIYVRARAVSDANRQSGEERLAARQLAACRATASRLRAEVAQECIDIGVGANDIKRTGLAVLLNRLQRNDVDYVIVTGWDRLARSRSAQRQLEQAMASCGAQVVTAKPAGSSDSAGAVLFMAEMSRIIADLCSYEHGLAVRRGKARARRHPAQRRAA